MERLTEKIDGINRLTCYYEDGSHCEPYKEPCAADKPCAREQELIDRLAAYEDAGLPPCNVGDKIYRIEGKSGKRRVAAHEIEKIEVHKAGVELCFGWRNTGYECVSAECIGKTVFLTRKEAKAALAKDTNVPDKEG